MFIYLVPTEDKRVSSLELESQVMSHHVALELNLSPIRAASALQCWAIFFFNLKINQEGQKDMLGIEKN